MERFFAKMKQFRGIATRYDKLKSSEPQEQTGDGDRRD
ncbi:hypothetical protein [Acetobacter sp. AC2005]